MKTLYLHGLLEEKYGGPFLLDIDTPKEAVRALAVQLPGFKKDVEVGDWHVFRGPLKQGDSADVDGISVSLGRQEEVHLIPAIQGAGGAFNVVAGALLIAAAVFAPVSAPVAAALMSAGAGMAVGGIIQMVTKLPGVDASTQESVDQRPSFLFNGPTNTSSQGLAVPRGYGRVQVGSIVVSAALYSEEISLSQEESEE